MAGMFNISGETDFKSLDWGRVGWHSNPSTTGAAQLAIVEGRSFPGKGHDFHLHPHQEEVILVAAGRIEQWIDREKRLASSQELRRSMRTEKPSSSLYSNLRITWTRDDSEVWRRHGQQVDVEVGANSENC
jgi:hypothetical protein